MIEFLLAAVVVFLYGDRPVEPDDGIRITRNYAAEWNERIAAIPAEDRAWPLYREAIGLLEPQPAAWRLDDEFEWPAEPGGHRWDEVVAYLDRNERVFELLREASGRARMGYPVWPRSDDPGEAGEFVPARPEEAVLPGPESFDFTQADLAALGSFRRFARVLTTDIRRAIEVGDAERATVDLEVMLGMSRHLYDQGMLISSLVGVAIDSLAIGTLQEALGDSPGFFSAAQYRRLRDALLRVESRSIIAGSLEFERFMFLDTVQRTYGEGANGMILGEQFMQVSQLYGGSEFESLGDLWRAARRAETVEVYEEGLQQVSRMLEGDPWDEATWRLGDIRGMLGERGGRKRHPLVWLYMPAMDRAVQVAFLRETRIAAAALAIEAELHRREHGAYPASREAFAERVRAEWPLDPFDGEPLRYALRDASPRIWSIGEDRDDDGGERSSREPPVHFNPIAWRDAVREDPALADKVNGDWVLFPPKPD